MEIFIRDLLINFSAIIRAWNSVLEDDAILLVNLILDSSYLANGDINSDNILDILDLILTINIILGWGIHYHWLQIFKRFKEI